MIPVLICGGFGTKMWPISRQSKPKHFIPLFDGKSLFQLNYETLLTHFKPEEIFISTNGNQAAMAREQAPDVPEENYILEPEMRNQGPATGLIAAVLYKRGFQDEPFMLVQTDVIREPRENFIKMMLDAGEIAKREGKYLTGGKVPVYAVMGVDYLIKGEKVSDEGSVGIYNVAKFVWRSSKEETEKLIKQEGALIHTNHTCMTPRNMLEMLKKYKPEWHGPLQNIIDGAEINEEYVKMPPGPIEDVTQKVHEDGGSVVAELTFDWYDIGTYESLANYLKAKDMYKVPENVVDLDGKDNFVKLDDANKVVALVGVDNLVVVDTGDALLICDKNNASKVKEARQQVIDKNIDIT